MDSNGPSSSLSCQGWRGGSREGYSFSAIYAAKKRKKREEEEEEEEEEGESRGDGASETDSKVILMGHEIVKLL